MRNSTKLALAAATAVALATVSLRAAGQSATTPPTVTVNSTPPVIIKQPKPKLVKYKGRVLAFNIASLIVQSTDNQRMVWTFQYTTELHNAVANMLSAGGFQPGDKVEVYCNPGTTVAVRIKGKASKPSSS